MTEKEFLQHMKELESVDANIDKLEYSLKGV
jgi:hypothetical protein